MNAARRIPSFLLAGLAALLLASPVAADEGPVVHAVLFWDRGCPNCEIVLLDVLPPIEERYGPRLHITQAEVSGLQAFDAYQAAVDHFDIPQARQGVPMLVIGEQYMVGADEIPAGLEPAIERGLAEGGVEVLPALGLTAADLQGLEADSSQIWNSVHGTGSEQAGAAAVVEDLVEDPVANGAAVAVLVFLGLALLYAIVAIWRASPNGRPAAVDAPHPPSKWVAVLSVAGLFVAGYLSYVKFAGTGTICPIGHCEAVQHSAYASLLGVPVAYLGFLTYVVLLGLWAAARRGPESWRYTATLGIAGVGLFGTVFSIYLTYLEIAVIHAVCIWCLASAVIMGLILIASVRDAITQAVGKAQETAAVAT